MSTILIIDDEADMRFAIRMLLERTGYAVIEAEDGEIALTKLSENNIDMVLLDMRLPGMDGIQILQKIREKRQDVPIIMVTGYGNVELADQALQLGADHYLSKPFHNKELIDVVNSILQKRGIAIPIPPPAQPTPAASAETAGPSKEAPTGVDLDEEDQESARGGSWLWKIGALVVLVASFFVWRHAPKRYDFSVPYSNPSAVLFSDSRLVVADWFSQTIYIHDMRGRDLPVRKNYYLPEVHLTGLAMGKDVIYTSDAWAKAIRKHKVDDPMTVIASVKSPGPAPSALYWDGKYLWSCDLTSGKIYQHQADERLTVVGTYSSPGNSPVGFYKDDRFAWSLDAKTRKLYQRRLDNQLTIMDAFELPEWEEGSTPLACFTWQGDHLWFTRTGKNVLFRRPRKDLVAVK